MMIVSLIRECKNNLLPLARSGATVSVTIGKGVGRATLDPTHCKVALACLIQNAAEAMRDGEGEIDLRVDRDRSDLCFAVSDNGIGIDEKVRLHMFDPFYSGREAGRGLGFGLSKSWRIAKLHGGSLTHRVDAEELRTVFELRLPVESSLRKP
jgi:signal transduction histidine kinase